MKSSNAQICPQVEPLYPTKHAELWTSLGDTFGSSAFKDRAIGWLSGAVQVPTESYDNMDPVGIDPRWDAFGPFHAYLSQNFPLMHSTLQITKVNTYGLVYAWKGSDESLKPLMLTAHQDVVPVDPSTVSDWEHPPYSGFYDGEIIWGRGSSDDKSALISIMSTIESFLETQFQPARTILLAFGFDEESDGLNGAGKLAEYLLSTYGENAFAAVVDEGGGFGERHGTIVATAGIAEKGYLDTMIEVATPGGHSSIPPSHTSIGILSALIVEIEAHPFEVHLSRDMPIYANVQCVAAHGKDISSRLRALIEASVTDDHALRELEGIVFDDPAFAASVYKALASTSQAIDLVQGGVKTNALPENAWAVINHRISTSSSVGQTVHHDTDILKPLAERFNLSYTAFGTHVSPRDKGAPTRGTLVLRDPWHTALEPAPITPTGPDAVPYRILSGSIKATYNAHRGIHGDNIVVSPGHNPGNTDTRYYWKLSRHIIRYNHKNAGDGQASLPSGIHTVNEHIRADDYVEMIRFFATLILNFDESAEL